jgi:hypothetical protein
MAALAACFGWLSKRRFFDASENIDSPRCIRDRASLKWPGSHASGCAFSGLRAAALIADPPDHLSPLT